MLDTVNEIISAKKILEIWIKSIITAIPKPGSSGINNILRDYIDCKFFTWI